MVRLSPAKQDLLTLLSELFFPNLKQIRDVAFAKLSRILKNVMSVLMGFFYYLRRKLASQYFLLNPNIFYAVLKAEGCRFSKQLRVCVLLVKARWCS